MYEGRKEMLFDSDSYFNGYNDMLYNFPGLDFSKKYEEKDEGFLNPNDENLFAKYKMWCEKLEKCSKEYESKYGPLCYTKGNNYNSFKWVNGSWPWESEDGKYV